MRDKRTTTRKDRTIKPICWDEQNWLNWFNEIFPLVLVEYDSMCVISIVNTLLPLLSLYYVSVGFTGVNFSGASATISAPDMKDRFIDDGGGWIFHKIILPSGGCSSPIPPLSSSSCMSPSFPTSAFVGTKPSYMRSKIEWWNQQPKKECCAWLFLAPETGPLWPNLIKLPK